MIYLLCINGASIIPFFVPGIPQILLLAATLPILLKLRLPVSWSILTIMLGLFTACVLSGLSSMSDQASRFAKLLLNSAVAYIFAAALWRHYGASFPHHYSKAILCFTVLGIIGSITTLGSNWSISYALGERTYYTNMLTTWIMDGGYNSSQTLLTPLPYRLQSMFDEPGTFGILLIPALIFYLQKERKWESITLSIGIILTESANAWALLFLIILGYFLIARKIIIRFLLVVLTTAAIGSAAPMLIKLYEVKSGIDIAYQNSSSLGTRASEYAYLAQNWENHILPLQVDRLDQIFPRGISVSYISWYIHAGAIFLIMLSGTFISAARSSLRGWRYRDRNCYFQVTLIGTLLVAGAQRSSIFDNILFMSLAFWCLLYRPQDRRERNVEKNT